jgi:hypothetical protein
MKFSLVHQRIFVRNLFRPTSYTDHKIFLSSKEIYSATQKFALAKDFFDPCFLVPFLTKINFQTSTTCSSCISHLRFTIVLHYTMQLANVQKINPFRRILKRQIPTYMIIACVVTNISHIQHLIVLKIHGHTLTNVNLDMNFELMQKPCKFN